MTNKAKDFYNIDESKFSVIEDEDYCSFCGGWISKMLNHKTAHRLKHKIHRLTQPAKPNLKQELDLLNSYHWYSQDITKPKHLRPNDPRLEKYLKQKAKLESKNFFSTSSKI